MNTLRAGLVGLGMMGHNHLRVLSRMPGVRLVGVADPVVDQADIVTEAKFVSTVTDLIALGLDYCVVAAPTALHLELGLQLAEAGVPTLIEKPLATDLDSAYRLVDAFDSADLIAAVGHIERYNPALGEARRRIAAGALGEIYQVATRRQSAFPARIADVGVVMDLATHDIDLTAWVTRSRYAEVSARVAHRAGRAHEDLVTVVGTLEDGTVVSHLVNWLSPFKERSTVITGANGAFVVDTVMSDVSYHANGVVPAEWDDLAQFRGVSEGDVIRYAIAKPEPLRIEHEQFRDAILGQSGQIVALEEGLAAVVVADAVLRSARNRQTVAIS